MMSGYVKYKKYLQRPGIPKSYRGSVTVLFISK